LTEIPLASIGDALNSADFWTGVGILAAIYAIVGIGLQLNVGYTGISNFGAAGFMAVGAYSMAVITLETGISFWISLPLAMLVAIGFGILVGLPALRLRTDYLAIATIAMAEVVRLIAVNWREVTGGNLGLFCDEETGECYFHSWNDVSGTIEDWIRDIGWNNPQATGGWSDMPAGFPLLLVALATLIVLTIVMRSITRTPWGRILRAVREDEDAARALGKNTFFAKLQSLAISAAVSAIAGFLLALYLTSVAPAEFEPLVTFFAYGVLVLGGLGSYWGILPGSVILWTLFELTRELDLKDATDETAVRYAIIGLVLILLMAFRPQGMFGRKEEMVLGE
jgi:branched-chain amino acid transport system permease protein